MKLKVIKIHGRGNYWQECLMLEVLEDFNLGMNLVIKATAADSSEELLNCKDVYWFTEQDVKEGDLIWLYSCTGEDAFSVMNSGITIHTLFWGLPAAVWNDRTDYVVLSEAACVLSRSIAKT